MGYLDEYILEVKKYIAIHPDITELELIRYVYLILVKDYLLMKDFCHLEIVKQDKICINIIVNLKMI